MAEEDGRPPWRSVSFRDYALENGCEEALAKATEAFSRNHGMDNGPISRLNDLFVEYMGGDLSFASLGRMITSQGYETVNNMNKYIETYLDGRPSRLYVDAEDVPSPTGRFRFVSFGRWNVSSKDGVDFYPLFALGMVSAIDPMFNRN